MNDDETRENQDDELRRLIRLRQSRRIEAMQESKLSLTDIASHAVLAFGVAYNESKIRPLIRGEDMHDRFKRTFGDKPVTPCCCNHCIN